MRVKEWKGPYKFVINILEAGLNVIGWVRYDTTILEIDASRFRAVAIHASRSRRVLDVWLLCACSAGLSSVLLR